MGVWTQLQAPVAALVLVAAHTVPARAGGYTLTPIVVPGQTVSEATGINDRNEVVGGYGSPSAGGFIYSANGVTTVTQSNDTLLLTAINDQGKAIGFTSPASGGVYTPFVYNLAQAKMRTLHISPDSTVLPVAIGPEGAVAGNVYPTAPGNADVGFLLRDQNVSALQPPGATATFVTAISPTGVVLGTYKTSANGPLHGFTYTSHGRVIGTYMTFDPPGSKGTSPAAITDNGTIVGSYTTASGTSGFVLTKGTYKTVDYPGAGTTSLVGMDSRGEIFGNAQLQPYQSQAFVYAHGTFQPIAGPAKTDSVVITAVNAQGSLAGYFYPYNAYTQSTAFLATCPGAAGSCD